MDERDINETSVSRQLALLSRERRAVLIAAAAATTSFGAWPVVSIASTSEPEIHIEVRAIPDQVLGAAIAVRFSVEELKRTLWPPTRPLSPPLSIGCMTTKSSHAMFSVANMGFTTAASVRAAFSPPQ